MVQLYERNHNSYLAFDQTSGSIDDILNVESAE